MADAQRMAATVLQFPQEILAVEVVDLLQIPKNDASLSPQLLWQVHPLHFREIVVKDVAQRSHILLLCHHHFLHDMLWFAAIQKKEKSVASQSAVSNLCLGHLHLQGSREKSLKAEEPSRSHKLAAKVKHWSQPAFVTGETGERHIPGLASAVILSMDRRQLCSWGAFAFLRKCSGLGKTWTM